MIPPVMAQNSTRGVEVDNAEKGVSSGWLRYCWIHSEVMILQCHLPPIRVVTCYPVSPVIPVTSVLSDPGSVFHFAAIGPYPEIEPPKAELFSCFCGLYESSTVTVRDINPSVKTPTQSITSMLFVTPSKTLIKDHL